MTRYTNVALKRKYVQATQYREPDELDANLPEAGPSTPVEETRDEPEAPPKKKRKRGKKKKVVDGEQAGTEGGEKDGEKSEGTGQEGVAASGETKKQAKAAKGKGKKKSKEKRLSGAEARKAASEKRRLQRQRERYADTTCYMCRELGHAARDCPKSGGVGICYRCGSRRHNLSNCTTAEDPANPLPFASCFVCSGKGHLASKCPQNQSKGIYPNGGCCKLCKETTHLAKDCPLRKNESVKTTIVLGTGAEAGADEDDFHILKRKTAEVVKEEKADERRKRTTAVKVGAFTGVQKVVAPPIQKSKKVIVF